MLDRDGAEHAPGAMATELDALHRLAAEQPDGRAGVRLQGVAKLDAITSPAGLLTKLVVQRAGRDMYPVRALLFDKSAERNWSIAWHQDRTVVVRRRREVAGFGPWTIKAGLLHVAPPIEVLDRMVTVRVHLDSVPATNAPLLVAPGSHRMGRVPEGEIAATVTRCGMRACLADAGDVWLYGTPILHASEAASISARRRVLRLDYTSEPLPGGLELVGHRSGGAELIVQPRRVGDALEAHGPVHRERQRGLTPEGGRAWLEPQRAAAVAMLLQLQE